ncbi:MAG TPA: hypothetical protein DCO80_06645 [Ornithinibacillus sp.]|nr:hypothetical protein [Ornithinibacillus sp.]
MDSNRYATLSNEMIPVVIGHKEFRGKGVGKLVINLLIKRAKELNRKQINVHKIYSYMLHREKCLKV